LVAGLLVLGLVAIVNAAPVLSPGFEPAATLKGAVNFRNFNSGGGDEVRLGVPNTPILDPPILVAGFAGIANLTWGSPNKITFQYDKTQLFTQVEPTGQTTRSATFASGNLGNLNYIRIDIKAKNGSTVTIGDININGTPVAGTLSAGPAAADSKKEWNIKGVDLSDGFTMTANLTAPGDSGDSSWVLISVGYYTPPDNEGPITSNVNVTPLPVYLNAETTVKAFVDDSTTGGSKIASAEYSLNGGPWTPMDPQDGTFDSVSEGVQATFTATQLGKNTVCVRGKDALGNVGDPACADFMVTYKFTGFFPPVENNAINYAKAGQAVPVKWRLTDANDDPIDDPRSFVGLYSYSIKCDTLAGNPEDAVEEYAAGGSGLQYLGDGYWQFNWKTLKDYANQCRAMYLEFKGETTSPTVNFKFKK